MAIFETMRVRNGEIPLLERHLARFSNNQEKLDMTPLPADCRAQLEHVVLARSDDHVVRVEWNGSELSITTRDLPRLDGLSLIVSSVVHPGYAVKTTDREPFDLAREEASAAGVDEALLLTDGGLVAEGTIFAIGWFKGDDLLLPSLDLNILPSIGRGRVIECAAELDLVVQEGRFLLADMVGQPTFATTSVRGVVGVTNIDGRQIPQHPLVPKLTEMFWP